MSNSMTRRSVLTLGGAVGGAALLGIGSASATETTSTPHVDLDYFNFDGGTNFAPSTLDGSSSDGTVSAAAQAGLITFDQFIARYNNRYIDLDGQYGAQCWDLWEAYCREVIGTRGIKTGPSAYSPYAIGLWDGYGQNGAEDFFDKISASSAPRKGDVAIWHWGAAPAPQSHVAVVVNDSGAYLNTFTQNTPWGAPCVVTLISKSGLAGYLRPRARSGGTPSIRSTADLLAVDSSGMLWNYPSKGNGSLGSRLAIGSDWGGMLTAWVVDWNKDGVLDILAQWNTGELRLYRGRPSGGFDPKEIVGPSGWGSFQITPAQLRSSDSYPGVVAKSGDGKLFYYPNVSGGALSSRVEIGHGWSGYDINALDFNGDGKVDVLGLDGANDLFAYWGTGSGSFSGRTQVGNNWVFKGIAPARGFVGSGTRGIFGQKSTGELYYYPIDGDRFGSGSQIGQGWSNYRIFNTQRL